MKILVISDDPRAGETIKGLMTETLLEFDLFQIPQNDEVPDKISSRNYRVIFLSESMISQSEAVLSAVSRILSVSNTLFFLMNPKRDEYEITALKYRGITAYLNQETGRAGVIRILAYFIEDGKKHELQEAQA